MRDARPTTLKEVLADLALKAVEGKKEHPYSETSWRYSFLRGDKLAIPKLAFNIKSGIKALEGNFFNAGAVTYVIQEAIQHTAFILDENGAEVESESTMTATTSTSIPKEMPHPKNMIFNKPFLVVLKRKDSANPYFAAWIENSELMVKK